MNRMADSVDVLIVGAGAAGLMCAIEAGRRGRRVLVLEHNPAIGRKILISGGGRCNFTNLHTRPENFLSANPHFGKSALARYTPADFIALVERHHIPYHEKTLGQLFCDRSAQDIVRMLEDECAAAGVYIRTSCRVCGVRPGFAVETTAGSLTAQSLVIATGGLSIPKAGASSFGYDLARQFELGVLECRPALVPLTFARADLEHFADLAGISAEVVASAEGHSFREKLLFTHRGLSGPAILQASSYWRPGVPVAIDLLPQVRLPEFLRAARTSGERSEVHTVLGRLLPRRLADRWCEMHGISGTVPALSDREIDRLSQTVHGWQVQASGTEGYEKAEVTAGGIDTAQISSKTFEAQKVPGLYFIGEVLDVTGHLGGFNFQWAWSSAHAAGQAL